MLWPILKVAYFDLASVLTLHSRYTAAIHRQKAFPDCIPITLLRRQMSGEHLNIRYCN